MAEILSQKIVFLYDFCTFSESCPLPWLFLKFPKLFSFKFNFYSFWNFKIFPQFSPHFLLFFLLLIPVNFSWNATFPRIFTPSKLIFSQFSPHFLQFSLLLLPLKLSYNATFPGIFTLSTLISLKFPSKTSTHLAKFSLNFHRIFPHFSTLQILPTTFPPIATLIFHKNLPHSHSAPKSHLFPRQR